MLSVVVITRNEETNILKCLKSVSFANEILVIDDYSTDKTILKARKFGAKIMFRCLKNDFASQRNYGLNKARGKWVLFLDADEAVSKSLASEIQKAILSTKYSAYYVKRKDFLWGRWIRHGEVGQAKFVRLVKKGSGKWKRKVHEIFSASNLICGSLQNPILHWPHPTIQKFITEINFYSKLHSQENVIEHKKSGLFKIVFYPTWHFLNNYLFKLGFLDGLAGLVIAIVMSFHSFLSWSNQWHLKNL